MIIAGDIGGTKTNLALFEKGKPNDPQHLVSYHSKDFPHFIDIVCDYLQTKVKGISIDCGCFAIAGPVIDGVCKVTNLPWVVSLQELIEVTGIKELHLINDLEANAFALGILSQEMLMTLLAGEKKAGNKAVISPGTGLGQAGLIFDEGKLYPIASEGGHCDFGPETELQIELSHYLFGKMGHVSYDRILSGPGVLNLYNFFVEEKKREEPAWLKEEMEGQDHSAVISKNALNGKSALCNEVLDLYVEILGQEAGNLCLKFMAVGGLYLGGGIPPKILPKLKGEAFLRGILNKGRFADFMSKVPVAVILDDKASLKGAGIYSRFNFK